MKTVFTKRASANYHSIKRYLISEWGQEVVDAFHNKTNDLFDLLEVYPEIGTVEVPDKGIRGFQLTKQIRIFYRIKSSQIIVLALFDVRKSPKKKPG